MKFELLIALRYLKSKQKERFISLITFISIAGVAVGVAALIVVLAVMSGFDNELKERIISTSPHIVVQKEGGIADPDRASSAIRAVAGVVSVSPYVNGQAMLRYGEDVMGVLVRGIDPAGEIETTNIASYIKKGSLDLSGNNIIVGSEYANKFRVDIGGRVSIISPQTGRASDLTVSAIFNSGMYEYDMNLVFVSLKKGQSLFGTGNLVSGIGVRVEDELKVNQIKRAIQEKLGFPFWARSWIDLNSNLFNALKLEKTAMFVILTLIVLVACFNIASTLIMIVMQKIKDIGILRAIGATRKNIMTIFTLQGFLIGLSGTAMGWGLGMALCRLLEKYKFIKLPSDIYYIESLPVSVNLLDTVVICAAALILSLLATLYPAYSASRFEPVEAIRYE